MMEVMMVTGRSQVEPHVVLNVEDPDEQDLEDSFIPKIPERLIQTDGDCHSYEPRIISIGPYHRGKKNLKYMEKHKRRYLQAILSRNITYFFIDYVRRMEELQKRARRYYSGTCFELNDREFVKMLLLDGCFVVEFLLRLDEGQQDELHNTIWMVPQIQYDLLLLENQLPFFILEEIFCLATAKNADILVSLALNACKKFCSIYRPKNTEKDGVNLMCLALNACKMFCSICRHKKREEDDVQHLQGNDSTDSPPFPVHHLLHLCYWLLLPEDRSTEEENEPSQVMIRTEEDNEPSQVRHKKREEDDVQHLQGNDSTELPPFPVHHLLHLCYWLLLPEDRSTEEDNEPSQVMIPSATVLEEAGIKFKKIEGSIIDVKFDKRKGVMKIPALIIDSFTMYQFRNLITFEQLCPNMQPFFTTYVLFMDYLVNTREDIALLHGEDIIHHMLGSDKDVALLFNNITRATVRPRRHYLSKMFDAVEEYRKNRRHRWRKSLVHNYFSTPWQTLSVIAAFVLLFLTLVQTFFAFYGYFRPPL